MTMYEVHFAASAAREFRSLSRELKPTASVGRIGRAIDGLSGDPRPSGVRKLVGHESLYRIRVGRYRAVYDIDDQGRSIRITRIRHRREVYR